MIPPPFRYMRPYSVDEALTMLSAEDGSVALSGGQSLINALKLDLVSPSALVDVHRLDELNEVEKVESGIRIGAAVTYATLASHPLVRQHVPMLATVAGGLVDRQVRNRGTLGGNCCLNDPTNNLPPLLASLDAAFEVREKGRATRVLDPTSFFVGTLVTEAQSPALLTSVTVPLTSDFTRVAYRHQQVGADSWAVARAVVRVDTGGDHISLARVYLGAVPNSPLRLPAVEDALVGRAPGHDTTEAALVAFDHSAIDVTGDSHGSPAYRLAVTRVQLKRALTDICKESVGTKEDVA